MVIEACIEKLTYSPFLPDVLPEVEIRSFDINSAPKAFLLKLNATVFAVSKWVSPKRTRTYPYERVYDTLGGNLKIAVIPVVKDEGAKGDRDFLQWDTVSLMSLLNVYVIFAYYVDADKSGEKITNQQLDNAYVINRIEQIQKFHSSALHWNLDELKQHFDTVLQQVQHYYNLIAEKTGVKLHSNKGIGVFRKRINNNMEEFKQFSREKAAKAQAREFTTMQPKELLSTATKAKIIIQNYLGGKYFLTVDEVKVDSEILYLMEAKHSKNALLPSKSDIKDGLLKLLLYCN
ncbi:MAG TPA: hypothetical protein PK715_01950, partial [Chitinophagales bacterium]|nr:hypothetical protein [Chitinophagales bacterium]